MSGVFGILRLDSQAASEADLSRQAAALRHLGPDGEEHWRGGPAGLGALLARTSIEDDFDAQPLFGADSGVVFVCDARLDNRQDLANALSIDPTDLARMPDSALLFAAFEAWDETCVDHLVGDFVFVAWDARRGRLVIGRDHMGQRHLFFHHGPDLFAFASERKGLYAVDGVPRILPDAMIIRSAVTDWDRPPDVEPLDGIGFVRGGTVVTVTLDGDTATRRYWEPHPAPEHLDRDEAYYVEAYRRVLGEAVACRLRRTTRPAGLLMGGGFDSSAICALAGPTLAAQDRRLTVVSSVMPESYAGPIAHARRWVEICRRHMPHLDVRYVTREGIDVLTGVEQAFMAHDSGHSPNRYVSDALYRVVAASGARVVMDGHGGDYTLNPRAPQFLAMLLERGQFRRFAAEWRARRRFIGVGRWRLFRAEILRFWFPRAFSVWARLRMGLAPFGTTQPYSKAMMKAIREAPDTGPRRRARALLDIRQTMERTLGYLQNNASLAGSITSAAHGLTFTQPFHDKRVVELALAIPETLYVKDGRERHLARTALKDLYPPEFQNRRPGNHDADPDFLSMARAVEPRILAEIDRMEQDGRLSAYFDFPRMRTMLTQRPLGRHVSGNELDARQAISAFLRARYIEWFRRENA